MHTVSLILVNYNTNDLTRDCLESLKKLQTEEIELRVLVVDNASDTPFTLKPSDQKIYRTEVLRSDANLGFTGGNNLGIHYAVEQHDPDYVMLLNNDTFVAPDLLETMIAAMEDESNNYGICSPKIYFAPGKEFHEKSYAKADRGKVLWYAGGSIDWNNFAGFHRGVDEVDRGQFAHQKSSNFATGCCMLIKREVLEKIGLLDKRFFMYFEDVDWSVKVRQFGYEVGYVDATHIWHINAGSSQGSGSQLHQYYQNRNKFLFFYEYGSNRQKLRVATEVGRLFMSGSETERKAALDFSLRQFGKQPVYFS